jgi:hypothetical protein
MHCQRCRCGRQRDWLRNVERVRSPDLAVELLEDAHHHGGTHQEGCYFHELSPAVGAG